MSKLLAQYLASRSLKLAQKIRSYDRSHPMAACMLDSTERDALADAIHHATQA